MAISRLVLGPCTHLHVTGAINRFHLINPLPGFATVAACIHGQRTTDRAWNACHKLGTCTIVAGGKTCQLGAGDTSIGIHTLPLHFQRLQCLMHDHHRAAHTAITHQQVATQANKCQWLAGRQLLQKLLQMRDAVSQHQTVCRTTDAPAGITGQWLVLQHLQARRF